LKGDMVEMMHGEEKGRQGKVLRVFRKRNKVVVEGLNVRTLVYTNTNGSTRTTVAPMSIHYSNVALVDPEDGEKCKTKYMFTEEGTKVRVSKRTGAIIPYNCIEEVKREAYELDTPADLVTQVTFEGR
jgi:large subunit ribosomal protein L24